MTEQERKNQLHEKGRLVCLNRKGKLVFQQRFPDFPNYISLIATLVSVASLILVVLIKLG